MLHIATLHYASPRWIEIQTGHIREHISVPHRIYSTLEGIDASYSDHFDRVIEHSGGRHSDRLNHLALEIMHEADDGDLLMFLDGDAFPIADPMPLVTSGLAEAPLVAVRRAENAGDRQPHPCFCVTTVGTWRSLPGDWSGGYKWPNDKGGRVTDVGGNLLRALELTNTPWSEILRSNRKDLDPIFFAIYGDVLYHHGAGFHTGLLTRVHRGLAPAPLPLPRIPLARKVVERVNWTKRRAWERRTSRLHVRESKAMLDKISRPGSDWLAELM